MEAKLGLPVAIVSEAGTGVVRYYLRAEGAGPDRFGRLAEAVAPLRAWASDAKGSLVVLHAPPEVKASVDVWGPVGDAFAVMRGLKEQFDPGRVLNPGRFVGDSSTDDVEGNDRFPTNNGEDVPCGASVTARSAIGNG